MTRPTPKVLAAGQHGNRRRGFLWWDLVVADFNMETAADRFNIKNARGLCFLFSFSFPLARAVDSFVVCPCLEFNGLVAGGVVCFRVFRPILAFPEFVHHFPLVFWEFQG